MIEKLYKKENNLFQSSDWLEFQENYGRKVIDFGFAKGIKTPLFSGKSFIWIQKGPASIADLRLPIADLSKNVVFVRVEPGKLPAKDSPFWTSERTVLKEVTEKSILSGQKSPKATQILDISKTEDEILAQMKPKTRYNIRLAGKKGVKVRILDNPNDVNLFYDLLLATAVKDKGYAPHEKEYYKKMVEVLGKKGIVRLFIAEFEGKPLAGILVSFYGAVATYLHGGSSDEKRELMAPYLCQWEAIKYAKSRGCNLYDFWGVAETDDPNDPWAGITRFKKGFGGETVVFPGAFDIPLNRPLYYSLTGAAKIRHIMK